MREDRYLRGLPIIRKDKYGTLSHGAQLVIFKRKPPRKWDLKKYTYTLLVYLLSGEKVTVKRIAREFLLPELLGGPELHYADTWDVFARQFCDKGFILNDVFYPGHNIEKIELVGTEEQTFQKEEDT